MTREACERTIESVVRPLPGVESVSVDIAAKQVHVRYRPDRVDLAEVRAAIEARGYRVLADVANGRTLQ